MTLTAEYLRERLRYDPETGVFTWLGIPVAHYRDKIWNAKYAGTRAGNLDRGTGYVRIRLGRRNYQAHRLAFLWVVGQWPGGEVDHRNRDRTDNAWDNLRVAQHTGNCQNASLRADNSSGRKGVSWSKQFQKWRAEITPFGTRIFLGYFDDLEEAAAAYMAAAERHFGAFATDGVS